MVLLLGLPFMSGRGGEKGHVEKEMKDGPRGFVLPPLKRRAWALSQSCRRNWSTAPGSTASQCGLYLDFYYVCVCEHKTKLLPAARQLVRSILTGLNASGVVNPLPPSFFQPMVFVDGGSGSGENKAPLGAENTEPEMD